MRWFLVIGVLAWGCTEPAAPPTPRLMTTGDETPRPTPSEPRTRPAKPIETPAPAPRPGAAPAGTTVEAHFAERARLDRTLWAPEVLAQAHERLFVELWDDLRASGDPVTVLAAVPFAKLVLPDLVATAAPAADLQRRVSGSAQRAIDPAAWKALLDGWSSRFTLEQTEWHHSRFDPPGDGPARSTVDAELHVRESTTRWRVKLVLEVTWAPMGPDGRAEPTRIAVRDVDAVGRAAPRFEQVGRLTVGPHRPQTVIAADAEAGPALLVPAANRRFVRQDGSWVESPLSDHLLPGAYAAVLAELTGDAYPDLLATAHRGERTVLMLYPGGAGLAFPVAPRIVFDPPEGLRNVRVLTVGDIDGDGDADVFVPQYRGAYNGDRMPTPFYDAQDSWPAWLLRNDRGAFTDVTAEAGLAGSRRRHTQSASFFDADRDGDLDLLTVNDFAGVDLHRNDGEGRFTRDRDAFDNPTLFGMSHALGDFDHDGRLDLFAIGMASTTVRRLNTLGLDRPDRAEDTRWRTEMTFGNRLYLGTAGGGFAMAPYAAQVARSGWAWGVTAFDAENDGDLDLFVANGFISGRTAQDYCTRYWSHDVYLDDGVDPAAEDDIIDTLATQIESGVSWNGFEHNRAFVRAADGFVEAGYPLGLGGEPDARNVIADDLDGDGRVDLVIAEAWRGRLSARLMRNTAPAGPWLAVRLAPKTGTPWGAEVVLTTDRGRHARAIVTGDSFAVQHRPVAHFGLGDATPLKLEIRWPGGAVTTVDRPAANRVHVLSP